MTKKNTDETTVVVKLSGGLGNQMFQYAFGLAYSLRHNTRLKFYAQELIERNEHNGLELDKVFNIHLDLASEQDVLDLPVVKEPSIGYHHDIATTKQSAYFCGWWSSEKYFSDYSENVKKAFTWKDVHNSIPVAQATQEYGICAIHFRRGDYLAVAGTNQIFCCLGEHYYKRAVERMIKNHHAKTFLVFSDAPEEAIEFFSLLKRKLPVGTSIQFLVNDKKENSYLDMFLMTYCKGVIAANSSFSWWASKLNVNKNASVIMPRTWYTNAAIKTADIYPSGCIVL